MYSIISKFFNKTGRTDFDGSIAYKNIPGLQRITLQQFFNTPHSPNSVFDSSQEKAVKECLRNRIGIIQGPPGCGKTFIGIQMLRLLLSLSSLKDPKILVLTYKNHALDEFLKGIMKYGELNLFVYFIYLFIGNFPEKNCSPMFRLSLIHI